MRTKDDDDPAACGDGESRSTRPEQDHGGPAPVEPDLRGWDLAELLRHMSAVQPGPAAGSAAAISAAMAAALVAKTARLSTRQLPDAQEVATSAEQLRERALDLGQADAAGVQAMITGQDPPSDPSEIPRRIGALTRQVSELATDIRQRGKPSLRADAQAALNLAHAADDIVAAILASNAHWERAGDQ